MRKQGAGSDLESEAERPSNQPSQVPSRFTTAGNEADVEDNDNVCAYIPTTAAELFGKLRHKPPECCPTTPCRLQSAREDFAKNRSLWTPTSAGERLTTRPKSALESMADTISRPAGVVPPLALPDWHCLPLDRKIPYIPAPRGLLYYTPGKLSYKLHRKPKIYSTLDPYNRERVVGSPYTALHDPHAKDFMKSPQTRRILYSQGLINQNDDVMYSLKEFNKFRAYLRTLYRDDVSQNVNCADSLWKAEQEQLKILRKYLNSTEGKELERETKLKRAKWMKKEARDYTKAAYLRKQGQIEARMNAFWKEKELSNAQRVVRGLERSRLQKEKQKTLAEARRKNIIAMLHKSMTKDVQIFERRIHEKQVMKQAQENFLLEWMDAKINFSRERMDRSNNNNLAWHESLKTNARRRQRRMETYRDNLPKIIAKRKELEAYRWRCAKKYFYVWLTKTRERVDAAIRKSQHESTLDRGSLEETIEYLRFQIGHEGHLDTFILNILRLKEEIKRQLALEDDVDPQEAADNEDIVNREVYRRLTKHYGPEELSKLEIARASSSRLFNTDKSASKKSVHGIQDSESSSGGLSMARKSLKEKAEATHELRNKKSTPAVKTERTSVISDKGEN